jgi:hypothetical protein
MAHNQGIKSRNLVHPGVRTGSGSRNVRPAGVAQLGYPVGDHVTSHEGSTGYRGEPLHGPASRNFQPSKFGNEMALTTGPNGEGRTNYGSSGTNGQHGPVAGSSRPPGRGILTNE